VHSSTSEGRSCGPTRPALAALVCAAAIGGRAAARGYVFPSDAGVHDVKTQFGAKGDGKTDDTAALQAAFRKYSGAAHMSTVYFPDGVYLVSDQVWFKEWIFVQGQSREGTIIRLKDECPGYGDPERPKAVVGTTDPGPSTQCRNMNFSTHMIAFTIETGRGNPGANGIEFMSHNGGGLDDVTVRSGDSSGVYGIDMTRLGPGPALVKKVRVEGFNYGVATSCDVYSSVFEHVSLAGQRKAGWLNRGHPVSVRGLASANSVPAVLNEGDSGQFVILDSTLSGGSADACAIVNKGGLYARNVRTAGYRAAIRNGESLVEGPEVEEYASGRVESLFPSGKRALGLPVKETPELPWGPLSGWISVREFAHRAEPGDWAPAIQAAVDSGKPVVYFPHGEYPIRSTVRVRGAVSCLQGLGSALKADGDALKERPVFRIEEGGRDTVFIDRLSFGTARWGQEKTDVEHASARTLVVLHSRWMSYRAGPGAGELFVDDMCGGPWHFEHPQKAWIRQLNVEGHHTKVFNRAADLWILGYKSEGSGTLVHNTGPLARTEVLGGEQYPCGGDLKNPIFVNEGGQMSVTLALFWANETWFRESRAGETRVLTRKPGTRFVHLYVSSAAPDPSPPPPPGGLAARATGPFSVELSWSPSDDPESGIVHYVVYRDGKVIARPSGPPYEDAGLSDATAYAYRVSAVNGGRSESAGSRRVPAVTRPDTTPPRLRSVALRSTGVSPGEAPALTVVFTKPLDPASAADARNYSLDKGARVVSAARGMRPNVVTLTTSPLLEGESYRLSVTGVRDRARRPNAVPAGTLAEFRCHRPGEGLLGEYFGNTDLAGEPIRRVDRRVAFEWGNDPPADGIGADGFSVRWTGAIRPEFTERYTLLARTDDGVRVWLDGKKIIDDWIDRGPTESKAQVELVAGRLHRIRIEYYERGGGAVAELLWDGPSTPKAVVPKGCLYRPAPRR
jgi:hypothetical protein